MGTVVQFDFALFQQLYPEFVGITLQQATNYFNMATGYLRNDGTSPVCDAAQQLSLLNLLTAHIAYLLFGVNGQPPSGLVGRISSASEGSVSVSTDFPADPGAAWYLQSPYGAMYWQLTAAYRTFRYRAFPGRNFNPIGTPFGGTF